MNFGKVLLWQKGPLYTCFTCSNIIYTISHTCSLCFSSSALEVLSHYLTVGFSQRRAAHFSFIVSFQLSVVLPFFYSPQIHWPSVHFPSWIWALDQFLERVWSCLFSSISFIPYKRTWTCYGLSQSGIQNKGSKGFYFQRLLRPLLWALPLAFWCSYR